MTSRGLGTATARLIERRAGDELRPRSVHCRFEHVVALVACECLAGVRPTGELEEDPVGIERSTCFASTRVSCMSARSFGGGRRGWRSQSPRVPCQAGGDGTRPSCPPARRSRVVHRHHAAGQHARTGQTARRDQASPRVGQGTRRRPATRRYRVPGGNANIAARSRPSGSRTR